VIRGERYLQPLLRVAERLLGAVRTMDTVARLGGDEFAIVVPRRPVSVAVIADRIAETCARPFIIDARACCAGASTEFAHTRGGATTSPSTTSSNKPTSPVRR
jgi:GGDEF domain-containing protein